MADMLEKKDDERHHKKEGGVLENLTEQRMQEQMVTLERFYEHYDQAQWAHAVDMEHEVLLCLQAVLWWDRAAAAMLLLLKSFFLVC